MMLHNLSVAFAWSFTSGDEWRQKVVNCSCSLNLGVLTALLRTAHKPPKTNAVHEDSLDLVTSSRLTPTLELQFERSPLMRVCIPRTISQVTFWGAGGGGTFETQN